MYNTSQYTTRNEHYKTDKDLKKHQQLLIMSIIHIIHRLSSIISIGKQLLMWCNNLL